MLAPVHFSSLKYMAQSPAHYRYRLDHPIEPTAAMRIGTAAHARVLLGDPPPYAIWSGGVRRGKEWDAFRALHDGREIISQAEDQIGLDIALAVYDCAPARELLDIAVQREQSIRWTIGERECAGRYDAFGLCPGPLIEFKTTANAAPAKFPWETLRIGYLAQLAWYSDAIGYAGDCYIIAAESKPPHVVQVYEVTPASLDFGRRQYMTWWERLMACEAADEWPGYVQSIVPLEPPAELGDVSLTIGDEEVSL